MSPDSKIANLEARVSLLEAHLGMLQACVEALQAQDLARRKVLPWSPPPWESEPRVTFDGGLDETTRYPR
jgi:hypothetical protein